MDRKNADKIGPLSTHADQSRATLTVDSAQLFNGRKEIQIRHGEEVYRLRITSNGKLILNK